MVFVVGHWSAYLSSWLSRETSKLLNSSVAENFDEWFVCLDIPSFFSWSVVIQTPYRLLDTLQLNVILYPHFLSAAFTSLNCIVEHGSLKPVLIVEVRNVNLLSNVQWDVEKSSFIDVFITYNDVLGIGSRTNWARKVIAEPIQRVVWDSKIKRKVIEHILEDESWVLVLSENGQIHTFCESYIISKKGISYNIHHNFFLCWGLLYPINII